MYTAFCWHFAYLKTIQQFSNGNITNITKLWFSKTLHTKYVGKHKKRHMTPRKLGLLILLMILSFRLVYSDGGCCIEFTTRLTLKNDSIVTGYFFSTCGEFNLDSISMDDLVERQLLPYYYYDKDSIRIFSNVIRL